jgi:hypothetical protein
VIQFIVIVNVVSLHNPHLLRCVVPAALIKPLPLWDDRVLLHRQQAECLREVRGTLKAKNAAAAAARKALGPGASNAAPTRKRAAPGFKRKHKGNTGRNSKRQKISYQKQNEPDDDSDSDSDSESEDGQMRNSWTETSRRKISSGFL